MSNEHIWRDSLETKLGFRLRNGQVEAIQKLAFEGKDLMLIASTGWGKSVVFQAIPALKAGICLMVMPLNLLQETQAVVINKLSGCKAAVLNGSTKSNALLDEIIRGVYTHVLTGPEIILSSDCHRIFRNQHFRKQLVLVAIDEAHVVSEWGESFRKEFAMIGTLREKIPGHVPWLACSATLDAAMLENVRVLCRFPKDVSVQQSSVDRPEIKLERRFLEYTQSSYLDLAFLTDDASNALRDRRSHSNTAGRRSAGGNASQALSICCKMIPKTIVYIEKIVDVMAAATELSDWLVESGCNQRLADTVIKQYHAELDQDDKGEIVEEFSKRDVEDVDQCSKHRIIVATEAMGMGIDNPDIERVVQWRVPRGMCPLWQHGGRAARGPGQTGTFIMLFEPWTRNEAEAADSEKTQKRARLEERRAQLAPGLSELINTQACLRKAILNHFKHGSGPVPATSVDPEVCCNLCNPLMTKLSQAAPVSRTKAREYTPKHVVDAVTVVLENWRLAQVASFKGKELEFEYATDMHKCILPDKVLSILAKSANSSSEMDLIGLVEREWAFSYKYGTEVWNIISKAREEAMEKPREKAAKAPRKRPAQNTKDAGTKVGGKSLSHGACTSIQRTPLKEIDRNTVQLQHVSPRKRTRLFQLGE